MAPSSSTTNPSQDAQVLWIASEIPMTSVAQDSSRSTSWFAPLKPLRQWLNNLEIRDRQTARTLCSAIPAQCPFERRIRLFGRTILYIPPLCKLNPFYEELVELRFKALCYLADVCGEDITQYC